MAMHMHGFAAAMAKAEVKAFGKPDEVREFPMGRVELVKIGGATIGRAVFDPGWRWATSVQPLVNTKSCEAPHFQYHVSGILHIKMDDGSEFDCKPGDVSVLPSGHDAWVVGNEPAVVVDFQGMVDYASGHAQVEATMMLDGKSYQGLFIEKGKSSGDPDTLTFANGRFRSSACDQYGYGDAPYSAIADGETVHFNAETESPRYGKLVWKGVIKGKGLKGEILMVQDGKPPIENFINATLVTSAAKG
jgi:hypothetical protein